MDLRCSSVEEFLVKINRFPKLRRVLGLSKKRVGLKIHSALGIRLHTNNACSSLRSCEINYWAKNAEAIEKNIGDINVSWKREYGRVLCTAWEDIALSQLRGWNSWSGINLFSSKSQTLGALERLLDWISWQSTYENGWPWPWLQEFYRLSRKFLDSSN